MVAGRIRRALPTLSTFLAALLIVMSLAVLAAACNFSTSETDDFRCDDDNDCLVLEQCYEGFCAIPVDGGAGTTDGASVPDDATVTDTDAGVESSD